LTSKTLKNYLITNKEEVYLSFPVKLYSPLYWDIEVGGAFTISYIKSKANPLNSQSVFTNKNITLSRLSTNKK